MQCALLAVAVALIVSVCASAADGGLFHSNLMGIVWQIPAPRIQSQILASADDHVFFVASDAGITVRSAKNAHVLWANAALLPPIAVYGNRIVATTANNRIVSVDQLSGHTLWESAPLAAHPQALAEGDGLVLADVQGDSDNVRALEAIVALSSANGVMRWAHAGAIGSSPRNFIILKAMIIASFNDTSEPFIQFVEGLDPLTGSRRLYVDHATYADTFKNEIWLAPSDYSDTHPLAVFERYDANSGRPLETFSYAPDGHRNHASQDSMDRYFPYGEPEPTALTAQHLFLDVNGRLYRYDRALAPNSQAPYSYDVTGRLLGMIGENPFIMKRGRGTLLVSQQNGTYRASTIDLSSAINNGSSHKSYASQGIPLVKATTPLALYFSTEGTFVAVMSSGRALVALRDTCANTQTVLPFAGAAIALCEKTIVRFRIAP